MTVPISSSTSLVLKKLISKMKFIVLAIAFCVVSRALALKCNTCRGSCKKPDSVECNKEKLKKLPGNIENIIILKSEGHFQCIEAEYKENDKIEKLMQCMYKLKEDGKKEENKTDNTDGGKTNGGKTDGDNTDGDNTDGEKTDKSTTTALPTKPNTSSEVPNTTPTTTKGPASSTESPSEHSTSSEVTPNQHSTSSEVTPNQHSTSSEVTTNEHSTSSEVPPAPTDKPNSGTMVQSFSVIFCLAVAMLSCW